MSKQKPQLIITTGRPAAGKSTLAKWLSKELGIPFFSKDNVREVLFESLGSKDRKWAQTLGRTSIDIIFYLAEMQFEADCSVILDNSFDPSLSASRFQALKEKYGIETIQIVCDSDQETLFNRFRERAITGNRHQGHGDNDVLEDLRIYLGKEQSLVMDIGGTIIEVDTTDFSKVDYQAILNDVKLAIQKYQLVK
ncbi:MAG: AAA family ATPase [Chloroflexota bacterium]